MTGPRPHDPTTARSTPSRHLLVILATLALTGVAAACAADGGDEGTWTLGPTLAPSSGGPAAATPEVAPSGSVPVGSGAPVASFGPDTSSAPQPSAAP